MKNKTITAEYRKMAMAAESIEEKAGTIKSNMDVVLMISLIIIGGFIAICALLVFLYGAYNWNLIEENIPGGWKTFTASLVAMLGAIYTEYKTFILALHTDHGDLKRGLIEKARKPKDQIDQKTGLSIPSTILAHYANQVIPDAIPENTTYRNVNATEIVRGSSKETRDVVFETEEGK